MDWRIERGLELLLLAIVVLLIAGQLLGQPILLATVTSGSMEPTLQRGDAFVIAPAAISAPAEPGDVIVFQSREIGGGELTTHRVVNVTRSGALITKGDANPESDQRAGEPPVQREQVVAKAITVNGTVLAIPFLGAIALGLVGALAGVQRWAASVLRTGAVLGTSGLAYLLFAVGLLVYAASVLTTPDEGRSHARRRLRKETFDTRWVVAGVILLTVGGATLGMALPSGTQTFDVVSTQDDNDRPYVIEAGSEEAFTLQVENRGVLPVVAVFEPGREGIRLNRTTLFVDAGGRDWLGVTLSAPPSTGIAPRYMERHWYLGVLPGSTIVSLARIHPWLPVVVIDLLLGVGAGAFTAGAVGWGRDRIRGAKSETPLGRFVEWLTE